MIRTTAVTQTLTDVSVDAVSPVNVGPQGHGVGLDLLQDRGETFNVTFSLLQTHHPCENRRMVQTLAALSCSLL